MSGINQLLVYAEIIFRNQLQAEFQLKINNILIRIKQNLLFIGSKLQHISINYRNIRVVDAQRTNLSMHRKKRFDLILKTVGSSRANPTTFFLVYMHQIVSLSCGQKFLLNAKFWFHTIRQFCIKGPRILISKEEKQLYLLIDHDVNLALGSASANQIREFMEIPHCDWLLQKVRQD